MSERVSVLLSEEAVDKRIKEIGEQITKDYEGKNVHLICVLKGGVFFMCELAKRIEVPVSMDFMAISSYGTDTKSSGIIKIVKDLDESIKGKDVLVVEDIVDSGRTLSYLLEMLKDRKPNSLRLCTLLEDYDPLTNEDVSIYFFDKDMTISHLKMHSNAQMDNWPKGFFDQAESDSALILKLGLFR